jgi:hypothetical protein
VSVRPSLQPPARLPGQPELVALDTQPGALTVYADAETVADLAAAVTAACAAMQPGGAAVIDAPGKFQRWRPEAWGSPAAVSREQSDSGAARISADCRLGDKDKWAVTLFQDMDLSKCDSLSLHVRSDKAVKIVVGLWTDSADETHLLYESRAVTLTPGGWRKLTLNLREPGFKAAASQWEHTAALANPDKTRAISLLLYGTEPCKVEFSGVWVFGAPAPSATLPQ